MFLSSADFFFQNQISEKNLHIVKQSVGSRSGPPFWVQTVCKCYQQTTLIGVVCSFFYKIKFFKNSKQCKTVWIQIRPDILLGLIWVLNVCKWYRQTTLVGKEFTLYDSKTTYTGTKCNVSSKHVNKHIHY